MTDQLQQPDDHATQVYRRSNWATIGIFFSTLGAVLFMGAFAWGYFALAKATMGLTMTVAEVKTQTITTQNQLVDLKKNINDLQEAQQKSQALVTQQQQTLANWQTAQQGDGDKWRVSEAHYLVNLAQHQLQFTHDVATAIVLLQQADQVLQKSEDQKTLALRQALALDLARLQAVQPLDITAIYLRLSALNHLLDQLPLLSDSLKSDKPPASLASSGSPQHLSWWQTAWASTIQSLSKIVIVRKTGPDAMPFALPEEKLFLNQNLHAQITKAEWALLHRNAVIYQDSLARIEVWIRRYFATDVPVTQFALQNIKALQAFNIQPPVIDLTNTSQLFVDDLSGPH